MSLVQAAWDIDGIESDKELGQERARERERRTYELVFPLPSISREQGPDDPPSCDHHDAAETIQRRSGPICISPDGHTR